MSHFNLLLHLSLLMDCVLLSFSLYGETVKAKDGALNLLSKAECFFAEGLYADALPLYSSLMTAFEDPLLNRSLQSRLATCYLEEGLSQNALDILFALYSPLYSHDYYLISLAYRYLGDSVQALKWLNACPTSPHQSPSPSLIALEKSYHFAQVGEAQQAVDCLRQVIWDFHYPVVYYLAQLQWIKISLSRDWLEDVELALTRLDVVIPKSHPLKLAHTYLKGIYLLKKGAYRDASNCLEQILPQAVASTADGSIDILKSLVVSYLRQALDSSMTECPDTVLLKAERVLERLKQCSPVEIYASLLGDFYLVKSRCLNDSDAYAKAKEWWGRSDPFLGCQNASDIALKLAEGAPSYEERCLQYERLVQQPAAAPVVVKGWWLKGMNEFEEGVRLRQWQEAENMRDCFGRAAQALIRAIQLGEETKGNDEVIAVALKYLALCYKWGGCLCLQLNEWEEADRLFVRLSQEHPLSCAEAWFWLAYHADQQRKSDLKKEYLARVYTQCRESPYAASAYFHLYSYREYMQGQRKPIKHLQVMPLLFPSHPLLVNVYYLLGLDQKKDRYSEEGKLVRRKDGLAALASFQKAEATFDALFENHLIPPDEIPYFIQVRDRAQLERAQMNFALAQQSEGGKRLIYLEYAEEVFRQIIHHFMGSDHPLKKWRESVSPYNKVWAAAELELGKVYSAKQKWLEAEEIFNQSLAHYRQAQMTQCEGLKCVWYEKGLLAQQRGEDRAALQCYMEAEKSMGGGAGRSSHERIDLWIQQSLCYRRLNQLDEAMRLLSAVINDDVISSLRVKAMFLRAEIYELQRRPELAMKQLEATSRKGGEWARQAQKKLEQTYGYTTETAHSVSGSF